MFCSQTAKNWKQILRLNFTHWKKLADFLELNEAQREEIFQKPRFVLNLPFRLAEKIEKGKLNDPILKQFLPTNDENIVSEGFVNDPVGDLACRRGSKLLHKYNGRVLLVCTSACAMHCRYCFRQNFDYEVEDKTFAQELECIQKDRSIKEVILSGGDPLSLSEMILEPLLMQITKMPHIKRIRFHTRFPIGIPERIDEHFIQLIEKIPQQLWFILHTNHPRELDDDIFMRIKLLQQRGVVIGNQAVLLKGVNDDVDTLQELCEKLVDHGILPYYLHQLDRVQGAQHFEVSEQEGLRLIEQLITRLPGYAVPKFVREIAGQPSKTPIYYK